MTEKKVIPYSPANWYQALTGKPYSARKELSPERWAIVEEYAKRLSGHMVWEFECAEFSEAFSAVLDMYEDYLDAAYDLEDHEVDELCFYADVPRIGFDRYVKIAKLQKQVPAEIEVGRMNGKKWASDPAILAACYGKN